MPRAESAPPAGRGGGRYDFDLFVIGAGSGGVRAARTAAGRWGKRTGIAENSRLGGTCVMRGCVPKKLLVYASRFAAEFEDAAGYGWTVAGADFDWPALIAAKNRELDRLEGIYAGLLDSAGVKTVRGRARLADAHTVEIDPADGGAPQRVTAETVLIATGGRPFLPDIPGVEHAVTSDEALDLPELPERIVIIGGGYIAVEFAGIFNGLGAEVTLALRGDNILRGFDEDIRTTLAEDMRRAGVDIRTGAQMARIEKTGPAANGAANGAASGAANGAAGGGFALVLKDGAALKADLVMCAAGRTPNTAGLGLEAAGVKTGLRGEVAVDAYSRSAVQNIYAIGDVTDRMALTPVAIAEAMALTDTLYGAGARAPDYAGVPTAVFSNPPAGTVGLTEAEAAAAHGGADGVDVYITRFKPMKHTMTGRCGRTMMKLIVDKKTDRVVGAHMTGADAPELVQLLGVAVKAGASKADFDATVGVHPTAAEEFVTMRTPRE